MEGLTILLCFILSLPLILMLLHTQWRANNDKKLPPGPPALLFIAKFFATNRRSVFHIGPVLREMHALHGPIISIWLGRTFVFVADRRLAHSALVQGGGNFDDRPLPTETMRLFAPGTISSSSIGHYWRLVRRNLAAHALHPSRVSLFTPARESALGTLVGSLRAAADTTSCAAVTLRPPLEQALFEMHVYMCLGARPGPKALGELREIQLQALHANTGFPVFSIFPALTKHLLLRKRWSGYLALHKRRREVFLPLIHAPRSPEDPPCYADSLLELRVAEEDGRPLTDDELVPLCSEFMMAAMDTTACLLEWIMAELVNHPRVQAKVYEEVRGKPELVEGVLRTMPYLKAVVLEGLRLHPLGHLIFPHAVRSDAEIGGYKVPKGAEINFLVADFALDDTIGAAPREFRPERFLESDVDMDITGSREIKMAPFSSGRRMCPGYTLGILHAEYFVGSLVREFQWLPPAKGEETIDMTEELNRFILMKNPLRARIIPRT